MSNQKQHIALSRALFELRCGRAIALEGVSFQPVEAGNLPVGATLVAASGLEARFLPSNSRTAQNAIEALAINLLKRAELLPAFAIVEQAEMQFSVKQLEEALHSPLVMIEAIAQANVPLALAEQASVMSFRAHDSAAQHLAVIVGEPALQTAPLVRVHSSCITGDILNSLRCDCGDQLQLALKQISQAGHGVICYLQQEGRGIGISNKLRAYQLQDEGQDTLDANLALGYAADERDFSLAAAMLKELEISTITLLSNNPDKAAQLAQYGIAIAEQEQLVTNKNEYNAEYLATKAKRFGHKLD